jgi:hypothetical protein
LHWRGDPHGWVQLRYILALFSLLAGSFLISPVETGGSFAATVDTAHAAPVVQPLPRPAKVAIIDSGIARIGELREVVTAEFDMAAMPARPAFEPRDHHGTMVATILLREAKQPIEIISLRIDDPAGCPAGLTPPCQSRAEPVANAIRKATDLGVWGINISLTLKDDPSIVAAVRDATASGITVVLAAGNEGRARPSNLDAARAGYPRALLVGALDGKDRPWKGTNRPQAGTPGYLYVWQRGVAVPTNLADGSEVLATGTSFAAPVATAHLLNDSLSRTPPSLATAVTGSAPAEAAPASLH